MAIVFVSSNRGLTTLVAGGSNPTIDLPTGNAITVGNVLIMMATFDNSGSLGVDPNLWVVSSSSVSTQVYGQDLRGNLWFRLAKAVRSSGAANDGAVADIWACLVTNAYSAGDDITLQFSFPVANFNVVIQEWSGINPRSYSVVTAITGTGNGTTIGPTGTIAPGATGRLVVGVASVEDNTAITGDSDTTDGVWVSTVAFSIGTNSFYTQYKIVTGTTAQDWDVTKVGAADWAALAVVFEAFTSVPNGFVPGNPNYPCIAGAEILPLAQDNLPIDTGTQYLQTHQVFPNSYGTQQYAASAWLHYNPLGDGASYAHHAVLSEVYQQGSETVSDEVTTVEMFLHLANAGGGATVSSGSATDALDEIGGAYVTLPNGGYVDVYFTPSTLTVIYANYRVVRWGVQYLAWKDDSAAPGPGEGIVTEWHDTVANNGAGAQATISAWLVQNYKRDASFQTRWVGEINPIIRGKGEILAQNSPYNAAFTVDDLGHMASGTQTAFLRIYGAKGDDPSQATVYLDYIKAIVEVVPERRLAHGSRLVSNAPTFATTHWYTDDLGFTPMWSALNTSNRWQVPATATTYVLGTREPMPASPGDYYANQVFTAAGTAGRTVGFNEAIGPSYLIRAFAQPRPTLENPTLTGQPEVKIATIDGGVLAGVPQEFDNFILGMSALDLIRWGIDGAFWVAFERGSNYGLISEIYTGHTRSAIVRVDGTTQFNRVKVLVYPDELTTANLTITVEQPAATVLATATITPAQALAEPDLGNGWRELSVALNVAVTPTAGQAVIQLASTTPSTAPWRVAMGFSMAGETKFSYNYPAGGLNNYSAVLQCTLAVPSVSLGNSVQNMYRPTGRCLSSTITLPSITLTNGALYDWVSIERSSDAGVTYTPVVLLQDTTNSQVYIDSAVPWDQAALSITYRVIGYRNADHLSVTTITAGWNAVATAPGVAFGLAAPNGSLYAYLPTSEGNLDVTWNPLNPTTMVPLLGVDYQIPLRAPEERGLEVSFLVIVDQMLACGGNDVAPWDETIPTEGALSPAPFDQLRLLAKTTRFSLLLPGGHRRFVTLNLGGMTVKTEKSLYLSEVTLVDTTVLVISPYEDTNA